MSTERGNIKKKGPKYQNNFSFRHNPKSKKTQYILSLPNDGLCQHCYNIIEWKKKYRKYKPLTVPKRCTKCEEKNIKHAYHVICEKCASEMEVCAKCCQKKEIIQSKKEINIE
jgi:hypothetical protein